MLGLTFNIESAEAVPFAAQPTIAFRVKMLRPAEMMDHYFPNGAWLRLPRDSFNRLQEFKTLDGIGSWKEAIPRLLVCAKETVA